MRFEITTDPGYYGRDVTEDEAREGAYKIAEKLRGVFPEVVFEVVNDPPKEEWSVGEEELLDAVRVEIQHFWEVWVF